jgi:hypothetical protein
MVEFVVVIDLIWYIFRLLRSILRWIYSLHYLTIRASTKLFGIITLILISLF